MKVRKAVIPVAGLGTRFLPATKAIPKELLPIVDRPTVQIVAEEAVSAGIESIIFITGRGKSALEDHFDIHAELEEVLASRGKKETLEEIRRISRLVNVISVRQKQPLGLGHAVGCVQPVVGNAPFAVLLGDDIIDSEEPCIKRMIELYEKYDMAVVSVMEVAPSEVSLYASAKFESFAPASRPDVVKILDLIEKPPVEKAPSNLAVIGRYVLPPDAFEIIRNLKPGHGGEYQITDALAVLAGQGRLLGFKFPGVRYDAGEKAGFVTANIAYALKVPALRPKILAVMKEILDREGVG